jgi:ubiquinone/menaquinone biosynthesis C-methylase UbiE
MSVQPNSFSLQGSGYSQAQMDHFYRAFATGNIKPTSVMNYLQHLVIAHHCHPGDWVLDVCCGRALQIPLLKQLVPTLGGYIGMDIAQENLQEATELMLTGDERPPAFPCEFVHGDVTTDLTMLHRRFEVVIYTSALEHMEKEAGIASLSQVAHVLSPQGRFFLSTPRTRGTPPRKLQHRVHIYEWDREELEEELRRLGFLILGCYGLLSPDQEVVSAALLERFGPGASAWFETLQVFLPHPFLNPLCAVALPEVATELFYVCARMPEQQESAHARAEKEPLYG